jgi:HEAT repeat protein
LHDPNENVREKAAVALRDIGSVEALPALQAALADESQWVRRAARKSIFKLQELASEESPPF